MVLEKVAKNISDTCPKPCRSRHNHGKRLNKLLDHLPYCSDWRDQECTKETERGTNLKSIPLKPCTQMDYKSESTPSMTNLKNVAKYTLQFENPPVVLVKEEYLIYDTVSMISAIGGTLGICIGISFYHLATQALGWIKIGINQLKTNGRQPCETKTAKKVPSRSTMSTMPFETQ